MIKLASWALIGRDLATMILLLLPCVCHVITYNVGVITDQYLTMETMITTVISLDHCHMITVGSDQDSIRTIKSDMLEVI